LKPPFSIHLWELVRIFEYDTMIILTALLLSAGEGSREYGVWEFKDRNGQRSIGSARLYKYKQIIYK